MQRGIKIAGDSVEVLSIRSSKPAKFSGMLSPLCKRTLKYSAGGVSGGCESD